jgi:HSP20 family protein
MSRIPGEILARLDYFHRQVEELFHRLFDPESAEVAGGGEYCPPIDLFETPEEVVVRVDLPGVGKEAVELLATPDHLVLRGKKDGGRPRCDCLRIECAHGPFQRLVPLPAAVRLDGARARLDRGVLDVRLPKVEERRRRRRRIPIDTPA